MDKKVAAFSLIFKGKNLANKRDIFAGILFWWKLWQKNSFSLNPEKTNGVLDSILLFRDTIMIVGKQCGC